MINLKFYIGMKTFEWKGIEWQTCFEGGRIIHPSEPWYWISDDRIDVSDSRILLWQEKEEKEVKYWDGKIYHPTIACGAFRSVGSFGFGEYKAKIKLPKGKNLWPSFWLSGDGPWPEYGEFDILESWSGEHDYFVINNPHFPWIYPAYRTTTNVHYSKDGEHKSIGTRNVPLWKNWKSPSDNVLEYKLIWKEDSAKFYINGRLIRETSGEPLEEINKRNPKMRIIFNVFSENPKFFNVNLETPMIIEDFSYIPF